MNLATLNAASSSHRSRRRRGRRSRNRAESRSLYGSRGERFAVFLGTKAGVFVSTAILGYTQGNGGEPLYFSDDPATAWGLKAVVAGASNLAQLAQVFTGWSFGSLTSGMGETGRMIGHGLDGFLAGTADGSFGAWNFDQFNLYGSAKRSATATSTTSGRSLDYSRQASRPRPLASATGTPTAAGLPAYQQYQRGEGPSAEEMTRRAVALQAHGRQHDPWMRLGRAA